MQKTLFSRILDGKIKVSEKGSPGKAGVPQSEDFFSQSFTFCPDSPNENRVRKVGSFSPVVKHDTEIWLNRQPINGLWFEQDHVIKSGVLEEMTDMEKKLQETLFELITSEESHLKTLDILINHFKESLDSRSNEDIPVYRSCRTDSGNNSERMGVLKKYETEMLFFNIEVIRDNSRKLISQFETLQRDEISVQNYLDFLADHVHLTLRKSVVKYCSNINHQKEVYQNLINKNPDFAQKVADLEMNEAANNRTFSSYLITPMTRVCHMPLLIERIVRTAEKVEGNYAADICKSAKKALEVVQDVAFQCNQETSKLEDYAQKQKVLLAIEKTLLIPLDIQLNLITASRTLLCECNALQVLPSTNLFKNNIEVKLHFKLFHDILLICKPANDLFEVLDVADVRAGSVFLTTLNEHNEEQFLNRAKFLNPSQIQKQPISVVFFRTKVGDSPNLKKQKISNAGMQGTSNDPKTTSQSFQDYEHIFIIPSQEKRDLFVTKLQSCLSDRRNSLDVLTRKFSERRRSATKEHIKVVQSCADVSRKSSEPETSKFGDSTVYLSFSNTVYYDDTADVVPVSKNSAFSPLLLQDISNIGIKR